MRNYAPQLQKAFHLANSIFSPEILEEERILAQEYDNEKANQAIILYNEETKQILRLPYYNRFKREYVKAIKHKIWREIYPQIVTCNDFLFLTLDASTSNYYSQSDAHKKVQKYWNSLLTRLRKKYPNIRIIKAVEWQKNGLGYHLHILIVGLRFLPKDWIAKTWSKLEKSGWSIEIEKVFDNPKRALAYLLKYVSKTLRQNDEIPLSLIINWALRLRTIAVSHSFSSLKTNSNEKSKSDWVFLGIMPLDLALTYTDSEILSYFEFG
jgi:hypothetical protein